MIAQPDPRPAPSPKSVEDYVDAALESYEYFYRRDKRQFARRHRQSQSVQRLIDGGWISMSDNLSSERAWAAGPPTADDSDEPEPNDGSPALSRTRLAQIVRKHVIADRLENATLTWRGSPQRRFRRSRLRRAFLPALNGGAPQRVLTHGAAASRESYRARFRNVGGEQLDLLREQAERGDERQRERGSGAETRASYFAGAAGLTTTLVLANAGLLFGQDALNDPWKQFAVAAVIVAAACAVMAGLRGLQAQMITFVRCPPNSVTRVMERRHADDAAETTRRYVAALLVAQARNAVITDWKIARLQAARWWFGGVIVGVLLLTGFVLGHALSQ